MRIQPPSRHLLPLAIMVLLPACAVGPDYRAPAPPSATMGYGQDAIALDGGGQHPGSQASGPTMVAGMDVPAAWWTAFHVHEVSSLVEQALLRNPSIDGAKAALRAAHELVIAQNGAYYPAISASIQPSRQSVSRNLASPLQSGASVFNLTTTQLSVSYVPDLFGANQRMVETLVAQEDQVRFELEATRLTLAGNVVLAALQDAALRALIQETEIIIRDQQRIADSYRQLNRLGQASRADVAGQEAALAQAQAAMPPLHKQLHINRDLLAALLGRSPAEVPSLTMTLDDITLPGTLPLSLPAVLVAHRPDVRIAEAQLRAACTQVGVTAAARWPQIDIGVMAGSAALALTPRFSSIADFWGIAATLTQPIFQGGMLEHRQRAAEALFEQATAQYQLTVVTALQNTADALHALGADGEAQQVADASLTAVTQSLAIARAQVALGDVTQLTVLADEQALDQARVAQVQARASRYADVVTLFAALGGGWWNRPAERDEPSGSAHPASAEVAPAAAGRP